MSSMRQPLLSRRHFCACCTGAAAFAATGAWLTPRQAFAAARNVVDLIRSEAAEASITIHRLRGNVSVLEGSGGNIAVLTGPDGKLMVDAGITASRPRILEALASLGPDPIKHLINTHWHFDHADGNEWLHGEGATIRAHVNTRKHLAAAQRVEDWDFDFPPSPSGAIPSEVVADGQILKINRSTLALKQYAPAHTNGDISVAFTEADILHAGDTYWNGIYPFIDYSTGGSIDGMILATEANLASANETTIIIPGHGPPVSNRSELKDYRDMLVAIRENVAALRKQGRSLVEIIAAKPTSAYDAKWGQFVVNPAFFTRLVYQGT
jgi:glyoxylase-like metal-dependent hydrolase (beta-lactamase superfamily II)